MKFEITDSFKSDWSRLSEGEQQLFRNVVPRFNEACDRLAVDPAVKFPASLRVKDVENAPGVLEMAWSFSGPDGRATFEWASIDGERGLRWRRIGGHAIFQQP